PPPSGTVIRQPQLARTLYLLGLRGHKGFYEGEIAEQLVADVRAAGGIWTAEDLAGYRIVERAPLYAHSPGDVQVVTVPPPSSGGVALIQMLNILHALGWRELDPDLQPHVLAETMKLAYRDRAQFLGDADFVSVPVAHLTSPAYAEKLARGIRLDRAAE